MRFRLRLGLVLIILSSVLPSAARSAETASFASFDERAKRGEPLSVVFFGGSLTWGANASDPQRTSYRAQMADYLRERYPKAPMTFHDAAIGGTGSVLGMFRLDRDVLARKPDLVFLDFSANDDLGSDDLTSLSSYEALLRDMVIRNIPVVQCIFGFKWNVGPDAKPESLKRVVAHKKLSDAYGTPFADALAHIQSELKAGKVTRENIWPIDEAHPDDLGYRLFFEAARDAYDAGVRNQQVCRLPPTPVFSDQYATRQRIRLVELPEQQGWKRAKAFRTSLWFDGLSSRWMDDVLVSDADKGKAEAIEVKFTGTFVGIFGEAESDGMGFKAYIDGELVKYQVPGSAPAAEVWPYNTKMFGNGRLFLWRKLSDSLSPGEHTLKIVPVPNAAGKGGQLRIESICVAGPAK